MTATILLCDDETHILRAAEFKFRRAGFEVVCAADGEEAWEYLRRVRPDLVVTDCQMPRLDGIGLADRIRSDPRLRGLPILMLTAKGFELSSQELREKHGVLAVLSKPFSPRSLLQRVEQTLACVDAPASATTGIRSCP